MQIQEAEQFLEAVKLNDEIARVERKADKQTVILSALILALIVGTGLVVKQRGEINMLREHNSSLSQIVNDFQSRGGGK